MLIQQLLTLGLSQPRAFCASPLLGDHLTQQRTAVAWGVLELTPFTLPLPSDEANTSGGQGRWWRYPDVVRLRCAALC